MQLAQWVGGTIVPFSELGPALASADAAHLHRCHTTVIDQDLVAAARA